MVDWATQAFFKYGSATVSHPTLLPESQTPIRVDQTTRRPYQYRSQGQETGMSPDMSYISATPAAGGSPGGSYLATPGQTG